MTKQECLSNYIYSRWYNKDHFCFNYGYNHLGRGYDCPCKSSLSISGNEFLKACDLDGIAWNGMKELLCDNCKLCDGEIESMPDVSYDIYGLLCTNME